MDIAICLIFAVGTKLHNVCSVWIITLLTLQVYINNRGRWLHLSPFFDFDDDVAL